MNGVNKKLKQDIFEIPFCNFHLQQECLKNFRDYLKKCEDLTKSNGWIIPQYLTDDDKKRIYDEAVRSGILKEFQSQDDMYNSVHERMKTVKRNLETMFFKYLQHACGCIYKFRLCNNLNQFSINIFKEYIRKIGYSFETKYLRFQEQPSLKYEREFEFTGDISRLPKDVFLNHIFIYFDIQDLGRMEQTSKWMLELIKTHQCWKFLYERFVTFPGNKDGLLCKKLLQASCTPFGMYNIETLLPKIQLLNRRSLYIVDNDLYLTIFNNNNEIRINDISTGMQLLDVERPGLNYISSSNDILHFSDLYLIFFNEADIGQAIFDLTLKRFIFRFEHRKVLLLYYHFVVIFDTQGNLYVFNIKTQVERLIFKCGNAILRITENFFKINDNIYKITKEGNIEFCKRNITSCSRFQFDFNQGVLRLNDTYKQFEYILTDKDKNYHEFIRNHDGSSYIRLLNDFYRIT
jgi:hypothetical protein